MHCVLGELITYVGAWQSGSALVQGGVDLWDPGLKDGKGSGSGDSALPTGWKAASIILIFLVDGKLVGKLRVSLASNTKHWV